MVRKLVIIAALAAIPAFASAQAASDDLIIRAPSPDSYSMTINTAGKSPSAVRDEIWDAAHTVCNRAPLTGNRADFTVDSWVTCVNQALSGAATQYDAILKRR